MDTWRSNDGAMEVRLGRYQDTLKDDVFDALVSDPPYGSKTHEAYNDQVGGGTRPQYTGKDGITRGRAEVRALPYECWTPEDVGEFVGFWNSRVRGWMVMMTSHDLVASYRTALESVGRYVFPPLPLYQPGSRVRLSGDGPSNWTCWIVVSRPKTKEFQQWGTLPGGYAGPVEDMPIVGGKPLWAMKAIVRDYTKPGDRVVDPCCGGGTTALACASEGRTCVTSEAMQATYALAIERLKRGTTIDMFATSHAPGPAPSQDGVDAAYRDGFEAGYGEGRLVGRRHAITMFRNYATQIEEDMDVAE